MSQSPNLEVLEELTSNAKQIQENVLEEILKLNANTEYLHQFLHGSSDKKLFKKNVPVINYEDVKPYIDRVANGESFDVISGKPITRFLQSSGTSGGKFKIFPVNDTFFETRTFFNHLIYLTLFKYIENNTVTINVEWKMLSTKHSMLFEIVAFTMHIDDIEKGKFMKFDFTTTKSITPSCIPAAPLTSTYFTSDSFKNRASKRYTSPDQVILCTNHKQSLYCHLLCGLAQRNEVVRIGCSYASTLIRAITFLETYWKELCSNIRSGYISEWITDLSCRNSVSMILGGPNPELADLIENECSQESWEGIITRLWPKTKLLQCIITGKMAQYISYLEFYSNKLPIFSSFYSSSETMFGINMNPFCKPEDVSYTFLPNLSYFEFLPFDNERDIDHDINDIVDLVNVKLGCYYMPIITNFFGVHRYKADDVLQVTGFYNNAPQFKFVRRKNTILSIEHEATNEEEVLKALKKASMFLESSNIILMDFTCYADISRIPGHYVFYWELKAKNNNNIVEYDRKILVECCCLIEESLNFLYRTYRSKYGRIGALEIKVVQRGTFESLMEFFVSKGASATQYKTPICINSCDALAVLENKVIARVFSDKSPSLN